MDLNTLQSWLWRAASSIRGEVDAARYKDYILQDAKVPRAAVRRRMDYGTRFLSPVLRVLPSASAYWAQF